MDTAADAKLSVSRYWRIENGYAEPTPEEREALARALGATTSDVFPAAVTS